MVLFLQAMDYGFPTWTELITSSSSLDILMCINFSVVRLPLMPWCFNTESTSSLPNLQVYLIQPFLGSSKTSILPFCFFPIPCFHPCYVIHTDFPPFQTPYSSIPVWNGTGPLKVNFPVSLSVGYHSTNQTEQFSLVCQPLIYILGEVNE